MSYRLWVNDERTVLVRQWDSGPVELATREHPSQRVGPACRTTDAADVDQQPHRGARVIADDRYDPREFDPPDDFTDCAGGRRAMLRGCDCDACLNAGCDEFHRRRDALSDA